MSSPRAAEAFAPVAASGCGLLIALLFAGVFGLAIYPLYASQSWIETECDIVAASCSEDPVSEDEAWNVAITWRFTVGNNGYQTQTEPAIFRLSHDREEAEAIVRRFAPGRRVVCFYDPNDPTKSTLDRSPAPWSAYATAIGALFAVIASLIGVAAGLWRLRSHATRS